MRVLGVLLILVLLFNGCKDPDEPTPIERSKTEVFIANEGNFGWGEGTLSIYNPETKSVQNEVYRTKNGHALGNVFQSITQWDNNYFFVINNSGNIVITDTNLIKTKEITGLTSPRYMYILNSKKAYVTDLYAKAISVIDLTNYTVSKTIEFNGWSEKGVVFNNEFWVTAPESKYVYCIDIETDRIKDSMDVGFASESIIIDDEMQVWVLSKGDKPNSIAPALTAINPFSKQIIQHIALTDLPSNLVYSPFEGAVYYLNKGIYKMNLAQDTVPQLWLSASDRNLYALGMDAKRQEVYVSDIKDYVQRSSIFRYAKDGMLLDEFKAGIIASNFFFKD